MALHATRRIGGFEDRQNAGGEDIRGSGRGAIVSADTANRQRSGDHGQGKAHHADSLRSRDDAQKSGRTWPSLMRHNSASVSGGMFLARLRTLPSHMAKSETAV